MLNKLRSSIGVLIVVLPLALLSHRVDASPEAMVSCDDFKGISFVFDGSWFEPGAHNDQSEVLGGARVRIMRDGAVMSVEISDKGKVGRILDREHTTTYVRKKFFGGVVLIWSTNDEASKMVETFTVYLLGNLTGTLIWQIARLDTEVTKVSTFTAACRSAE